jgi:hypothetical protein
VPASCDDGQSSCSRMLAVEPRRLDEILGAFPGDQREA